MESTLQNPAFVREKVTPKATAILFWTATLLFCLQMTFTAYEELRLPQVAQEFNRLGFTSNAFRMELSLAKVIGVLLLLLPVSARMKEWAYAGFAINLGAAIVAHLAVGEGPQAWIWAAGTGVLWVISYFLWRRLQAASAR